MARFPGGAENIAKNEGGLIIERKHILLKIMDKELRGTSRAKGRHLSKSPGFPYGVNRRYKDKVCL